MEYLFIYGLGALGIWGGGALDEDSRIRREWRESRDRANAPRRRQEAREREELRARQEAEAEKERQEEEKREAEREAERQEKERQRQKAEAERKAREEAAREAERKREEERAAAEQREFVKRFNALNSRCSKLYSALIDARLISPSPPLLEKEIRIVDQTERFLDDIGAENAGDMADARQVGSLCRSDRLGLNPVQRFKLRKAIFERIGREDTELSFEELETREARAKEREDERQERAHQMNTQNDHMRRQADAMQQANYFKYRYRDTNGYHARPLSDFEH